MTAYIKSDLIAQLCRSEICADDLTLHGIAGRYGVSITPVRAALRELIDEGYVKKGENRRLDVDMSRISRAKNSKAVDAEPPKDYFAIIQNDFIRLSVRGEEMAVREEAVAEKYGLSRTSVRQIFHRLAGQGVLVHRPRHGWSLRPFRQSDLDSYIEVRTVLERKALELAWPFLVDADLQAMLDGNRIPKSTSEEPANDNSLHRYLIEKSGNHYIADFFDRHGQYYSVLFDFEAHDRHALINAIRQHRRILKSLLARDFKAADKALVDHIRTNHPSIKVVLERLDADEPNAQSN
jgi:DNA-binding GntR family transcriptional regulator